METVAQREWNDHEAYKAVNNEWLDRYTDESIFKTEFIRSLSNKKGLVDENQTNMLQKES